MTEVEERYTRLAEGFTRRVEGVLPGAWTNPSPCPDWTAHDVAKHVVDTTRRVLTQLTGGDPSPPDSNDDLAAAWQVESDAVRAALADPERAQTVVQAMGGSQPFEQLVGTLGCADLLIHTWDLARATGQDDRLDPTGIAAALDFLEPIDDMLRVPGGFGPKLDPPAGADEQTRFLAFCGRQT